MDPLGPMRVLFGKNVCEKMKELGPVGGVCLARPPRSANDKLSGIWFICSQHRFSTVTMVYH